MKASAGQSSASKNRYTAALLIEETLMAILFEPIRVRSIEFRNRIVVSPMCQYSAEEGFANDWHMVHLGSRAVGGAGLVIAEATAVSPEGRISPGDLGIWLDDHIPALSRIATFIHEQGSVAGIQIAHAGRKASHDAPWNGGAFLSEHEGGWKTVGPSAIPFAAGDSLPHSLTPEGLENVIIDFHAAAKRALEAGFKVLEIHAAHGYLLHEFLSPLSNFRSDEYGGSFENRIRLLVEVIEAVRKVWPDELPLFVRISATDWVEGGWTSEDSVRLASVLKEKGVDVIDCSTGGNVPNAEIPAGPNYQVPFAENVKRESGMMTGAVGIITSAQQAEDILQNGQADFVLLAREMLRDPYFPMHAAQQLGVDIKWPLQYERAKRP
ncbi:2,4-dienoyl-CoA reductase-like NADH-dependent reductase (Old Yellow Enzyme family) [Arcticibacter pallidicorallinus]|uniref:2,4-dienoyl-CoA reductase-like NADH-dependent reductase (Old Yellow Enzyme family) n=1 Tax=Arcticibacter pallidicorallinus TaxID=1259464 RepID=A0A2T0U9Q9_9SPHI|nr:NADPH dehydrogenase NamA [Arcticibacter pallidicorallinus]PRY54656.1 2,4-dienoyl-CoA reductase-like NADH-dependent reductase (Old Yellow Enzyme family) [Arcticibacter pallidicorallinus]